MLINKRLLNEAAYIQDSIILSDLKWGKHESKPPSHLPVPSLTVCFPNCLLRLQPHWGLLFSKAGA